MKVIIAGGRDYAFTVRDCVLLREHILPIVTEVVSGCATGADAEGEAWAEAHGIRVVREPAEWDNLSAPGAVIRERRDGRPYNVKAGFDRNERMAQYADACVLFPGGRGTADMAARAKAHGLRIFDWRAS